MFFAPLLLHWNPEETLVSMDRLKPKVKKALLTKGIIKILPVCVQETLYPKKKYLDFILQ